MKLVLLFVAFVFIGPCLARAENQIFCESGDPSGGGPLATVTFQDSLESAVAKSLKISVDYNRKNLESSRRSSIFELEGPAQETKTVREQGADCVQATYFKRQSRRKIQLLVCDNGEFSLLRLLDFTKEQPSFELGCQ